MGFDGDVWDSMGPKWNLEFLVKSHSEEASGVAVCLQRHDYAFVCVRVAWSVLIPINSHNGHLTTYRRVLFPNPPCTVI